MTNFNSDGLFDNDWEDRGELAWTEADWLKYLDEQEESVRSYIKHYDKLGDATDRVDEVARQMGWELSLEPQSDADADDEENEADEMLAGDWDPYTVHRNPVYISSRALYLSLISHWERIATQPDRVPAALAITLHAELYRGNEQMIHAVNALEMGDYTLAICLFKRALSSLNTTLARLSAPDVADNSLALRYREYALPRLFDLREIWLRVMNECRESSERDDSLD